MRWGEAVTIRWTDFVESRVIIRASRSKSRRSRVVNIPEGLRKTIPSLRSMHEVWLGREVVADDEILRTPKGKPWSAPGAQSNALKLFNRILKKAKIEKVDA